MDAGSLLVGRYELGRPIGSGGVGQVWSAHDTVLGREVAIKVQEIDLDFDPSTFERFVREARSAAGLQHPNVVTIFDSGTDGDIAFLVMELLPGPTLTGYLAERGPLPEEEAVALAWQVASGLAAAHSAGVVHRDIKPANLMFDARGTLKIVDFGIARLTQAATTQLTVMNGIIGSPPYLAPEGIDGRPVDERSDLYALGAVLMVMLTGRGPFDASHPLALLQQHLHTPPPHLRDRRPDISPALDMLVAQLLSKAPNDRPQSALEVVDRLHGAALPPPQPAAPPVTLLTQRRTDRRPRSRSMLGASFLAGAGATALVAAVMITMAGRTGPPAAGPLEPSPLALLPTVAVSGRSSPSPTAPTPTPAETSRPAPPSATPTPTPTRPRTAKPSPTLSPSVARSRTSATTSPAPEVAVGARADLASALADLRAAVQAVSGNEDLSARMVADLDRRVDGLAQQLDRKRGAEATKKVDEFDSYLAQLVRKGQLTADGQQQIGGALTGVRDLVADG
jgi:eukaryotic-like serine/threonine-protein kinase